MISDGNPENPQEGGPDDSTENTKLVKKLPRQTSSAIRVSQVGIYTVWEYIPSSSWFDWLHSRQPKLIKEVAAVWDGTPYVVRYVRDIFRLGPWHTFVYVASTFVSSYIPMLQLSSSIAVFATVEDIVMHGNVSTTRLAKAVAAPLLWSALSRLVRLISARSEFALRSRAQFWHRELAMAVRLRLDYVTSRSSTVRDKLRAVDIEHRGGRCASWMSFSALVGTLACGVEVVALGTFLLRTLKEMPNGRFVVLFSILSPVLEHLVYGSIWETYFAQVTNRSWIEMRTVWQFARDKDLTKDVLANDMQDLIKTRFHQAREEYGDVDDDYLWGWREPHWLIALIISPISENLTSVALAVYALAAPSAVQLTTFSAIVKTAESLQGTIGNLRWQTKSISDTVLNIKKLYDIEDIKNEMEDGDEPYPALDAEKAPSAMKVEFRNVSFTYPDATTPAIKDLSFVLPAGSLCVIVGENGCGKSSAVNLMSRFYDAQEGEILVDDRPLKSLQIRDVRNATAILYQTFTEFPTTLAENIGLGNPRDSDNIELVKEAARLGGSYDFISELPNGFNTDLRTEKFSLTQCGEGELPEGTILYDMEKASKKDNTEFSGGQYQRLAISRVFMRSFKPNIKLLVYDEPSSALDPKIEFALFSQLRELRGDKTMIFITHRFGHLTKYADLIIYMEKGHAIEQGTHAELLAANGPYAHLYNVQAQAFQ